MLISPMLNLPLLLSQWAVSSPCWTQSELISAQLLSLLFVDSLCSLSALPQVVYLFLI